MRFCGFDLELLVEEVVRGGAWPLVCRARDRAGGTWLIVQIGGEPDQAAWLCAPTSKRAAQAVSQGRCSPLDVVRHSATGTVELVAFARRSRPAGPLPTRGPDRRPTRRPPPSAEPLRRLKTSRTSPYSPSAVSCP